MPKHFDRQQDGLPAGFVGRFRLQDIRRKEYERAASSHWSLLGAVDEYLWSRQLRRDTMPASMPRLEQAEPDAETRPLFARSRTGAGSRR